jgi:hypothetical protein
MNTDDWLKMVEKKLQDV